MTEKEKILQYLDAKGIAKNKFYKKTGLSNGFLDSGSSLKVDKLKIIIYEYPDLNLNWIIFDEGPMITKEERVDTMIGHKVTGNKNHVIGDITLSECRKEIAHLKKLLLEKEKQLKDKEKIIELLEKR